VFAKLALGNEALSSLENLGCAASVDATQPCSGQKLGRACWAENRGLPFRWAL